jgi:hypothetical protein
MKPLQGDKENNYSADVEGRENANEEYMLLLKVISATKSVK